MLSAKWLILALAACAVGETGAHLYFKNRAPSQPQWRSLAPKVAAIYHPSDCIAVAPRWGEPLARAALGDALMPVEKVARADNESCERVIQIGFLGQSDASIVSWAEAARHKEGPFLISVRTNPQWEPSRYSFIDHLDPGSLSVTVVRGSNSEACSFSENAPSSSGGLGGDPTSPRHRFNCPGGSFHWVGVTIIDDERYYPRRCIWAPPNRGGPVMLRFDRVTLGRKMVGHAGGPWLMVRDGIGPPVKLSATVNQQPIGQALLRDTEGWVRFEWDTRALENTTADVSLTVEGTPRVEQRFCFTLDAR